MGKIGYFLAKVKRIVIRNPEIINDYFRKCGASIGVDTHIFSNISLGETFLITVGNNVTISNNVSLITHDASVRHYIKNTTDIFGRIIIGNNVFVGMNTTILPGVTIADNCVIGAGSVVTKSIMHQGEVWAGNPATYICNINVLADKYSEYAVNLQSVDEKTRYIKQCKKIQR